MTAARTSGPFAKESWRTPILNRQTRVELPKCEPGRRRPFRRVRKPWSFRLCDSLPRGVAVLGDPRPMLSCICTPARRIPRRPSNLTFGAVPHFKRKHLLQHISSTTISTKRRIEPLGGRRGSARENRRDLTRSCFHHLPLHSQQPAGTRVFSALWFEQSLTFVLLNVPKITVRATRNAQSKDMTFTQFINAFPPGNIIQQVSENGKFRYLISNRSRRPNPTRFRST